MDFGVYIDRIRLPNFHFRFQNLQLFGLGALLCVALALPFIFKHGRIRGSPAASGIAVEALVFSRNLLLAGKYIIDIVCSKSGKQSAEEKTEKRHKQIFAFNKIQAKQMARHTKTNPAWHKNKRVAKNTLCRSIKPAQTPNVNVSTHTKTINCAIPSLLFYRGSIGLPLVEIITHSAPFLGDPSQSERKIQRGFSIWIEICTTYSCSEPLAR